MELQIYVHRLTGLLRQTLQTAFQWVCGDPAGIPLPVAIVGFSGCHGDRHSSYQAVSAVKIINSAFRINRPQTSCRVWLISRTDNGGLLKYPNSIIHSRSLPRVSKIVKVKSELPLSALAQSSSESEDKRGGKKRFHSLG